jgi:hypothetical protein
MTSKKRNFLSTPHPNVLYCAEAPLSATSSSDSSEDAKTGCGENEMLKKRSKMSSSSLSELPRKRSDDGQNGENGPNCKQRRESFASVSFDNSFDKNVDNDVDKRRGEKFCNFSWLLDSARLLSNDAGASERVVRGACAHSDACAHLGDNSNKGRCEQRCLLLDESLEETVILAKKEVEVRERDEARERNASADCSSFDAMYRRGSTRDLQRPVFIERMVDWLFQFADLYPMCISVDSVHLAARLIVRYLAASEHSCGTCARWLPAACLLLACKWLGWLDRAVDVSHMVGSVDEPLEHTERCVRLVLALEKRVARILQFRIDEPTTFFDIVQRLTLDSNLGIVRNGVASGVDGVNGISNASSRHETRFCAMLCALASLDVRTSAFYSAKEVGIAVVLLSSSGECPNSAQVQLFNVDQSRVKECALSLLRFARIIARRNGAPSTTTNSSTSSTLSVATPSGSFFARRFRVLLCEFLELAPATQTLFRDAQF